LCQQNVNKTSSGGCKTETVLHLNRLHFYENKTLHKQYYDILDKKRAFYDENSIPPA